MTDDQQGNGNVFRSEIANLKRDKDELFERVRVLEKSDTTTKVLLEGYMKHADEIKLQISETNRKLTGIEKQLTQFDIEQAKKWTKVAAIGGGILFLLTSVPGIIFTVMKIFEMAGSQ